MRTFVFVRMKGDVLDPEGRALATRLVDMGYREVRGARVGKIIELDLDIGDPKTVEDRINKMARELLINPVIEEFSYQIADE